MRTLFCNSRNTRIRILRAFTLWFERKQRIRAVRLIQKSVSCLRSVDNLQNGATGDVERQRGDTFLKKSSYFYFLCIQKVFSLHYKIQIQPLMVDGLPWRCFSYFSGPWQWELLGSQWDSHKRPGFHPKYHKLCSEDEQSFYGYGTTWG